MTNFTVLIFGLATLTLAILSGILLNKYLKAVNEINRKETVIIREKSNRKDVGVQYFVEVVDIEKLFSRKHEIRYKMQLLVDNLPIGQPSEYRRDITKSVDKDQINKILDDYAKPLLEIGARVAIRQIV